MEQVSANYTFGGVQGVYRNASARVPLRTATAVNPCRLEGMVPATEKDHKTRN